LIQGERQPGDWKGAWHRQERGFGTFQREIVLPVPVDAERVEARLERGVLSLTLPKTPAAKPRKIAVQTQ
jgi:HSP20 family protein